MKIYWLEKPSIIELQDRAFSFCVTLLMTGMLLWESMSSNKQDRKLAMKQWLKVKDDFKLY